MTDKKPRYREELTSDGNRWNGIPLRVDQRGAKYQINRRRFTKNPGYFAHLPKSFPYYVNLSKEDVFTICNELHNNSLYDDTLYDYAVTSHSRTLDGHVTLWLSKDSADLLDSLGMIRELTLSDGWASRE